MSSYSFTGIICACGVCGKNIVAGNERLADHIVLEFDGSLDYIELAHIDCARKDNAERGNSYWEYNV